MITYAILLALALPAAAVNVFAYRYFLALWLLRKAKRLAASEQSRAMIALGAQLQEMLREQRCESAESSSRGTGLN